MKSMEVERDFTFCFQEEDTIISTNTYCVLLKNNNVRGLWEGDGADFSFHFIKYFVSIHQSAITKIKRDVHTKLGVFHQFNKIFFSAY